MAQQPIGFIGDIALTPGIYRITTPTMAASAFASIRDGRQLTVRGPIDSCGNSAIIERSGAATATFRLFLVENHGQLRLSDLTLQNGVTEEGGAIRGDHADLISLDQCRLLNNSAIRRGGGISMFQSEGVSFNEGAAGLSLRNCVIMNNTAGRTGGGLDLDQTPLLIRGGEIRCNRVAETSSDGRGGGMFYIRGALAPNRLSIRAAETASCGVSITPLFDNNFSKRGGACYFDGAINHAVDVPVTLSDLGNATRVIPITANFTRNAASVSGGAVFNESADLYFLNCNFGLDNPPAAVVCTTGNPLVSGGGNVAPQGGGVYDDATNAFYIRCNFANNTGSAGGNPLAPVVSMVNEPARCNDIATGEFGGTGAGLYVKGKGVHTTCEECCFRANRTPGIGGGAFCVQDTIPVFDDCVFMSNVAGYGGGIALGCSADALIYNCVLTQNVGTQQGGGVWITSASDDFDQPVTGRENPWIIHTTISDNRAIDPLNPAGTPPATAGSGVHVNTIDSAPYVLNSIIWGNRGGVNSATGNIHGTSFTFGTGVTIPALPTEEAFPQVRFSDIEDARSPAEYPVAVNSGPFPSLSDSNFNANPRFANLTQGNVHLTCPSPAIDRANFLYARDLLAYITTRPSMPLQLFGTVAIPPLPGEVEAIFTALKDDYDDSDEPCPAPNCSPAYPGAEAAQPRTCRPRQCQSDMGADEAVTSIVSTPPVDKAVCIGGRQTFTASADCINSSACDTLLPVDPVQFVFRWYRVIRVNNIDVETDLNGANCLGTSIPVPGTNPPIVTVYSILSTATNSALTITNAQNPDNTTFRVKIFRVNARGVLVPLDPAAAALCGPPTLALSVPGFNCIGSATSCETAQYDARLFVLPAPSITTTPSRAACIGDTSFHRPADPAAAGNPLFEWTVVYPVGSLLGVPYCTPDLHVSKGNSLLPPDAVASACGLVPGGSSEVQIPIIGQTDPLPAGSDIYAVRFNEDVATPGTFKVRVYIKSTSRLGQAANTFGVIASDCCRYTAYVQCGGTSVLAATGKCACTSSSGTLCVLPNPTVMCQDYIVCRTGDQTLNYMAIFPNVGCTFCAPLSDYAPIAQLFKVTNVGLPGEIETAAGACLPDPNPPANSRKFNCSIRFNPALATDAGTYRIRAYWQKGVGAAAMTFCPRTCQGTLTVVDPPTIDLPPNRAVCLGDNTFFRPTNFADPGTPLYEWTITYPTGTINAIPYCTPDIHLSKGNTPAPPDSVGTACGAVPAGSSELQIPIVNIGDPSPTVDVFGVRSADTVLIGGRSTFKIRLYVKNTARNGVPNTFGVLASDCCRYTAYVRCGAGSALGVNSKCGCTFTSTTLCVLPNPTVACQDYLVCRTGDQTLNYMATFPNLTCTFCAPFADYSPIARLFKIANPGTAGETETELAGVCTPETVSPPPNARKYNCTVRFNPPQPDSAGTYRIKAYWQRGTGAAAVQFCPRTCQGTLTVVDPPTITTPPNLIRCVGDTGFSRPADPAAAGNPLFEWTVTYPLGIINSLPYCTPDVRLTKGNAVAPPDSVVNACGSTPAGNPEAQIPLINQNDPIPAADVYGVRFNEAPAGTFRVRIYVKATSRTGQPSGTFGLLPADCCRYTAFVRCGTGSALAVGEKCRCSYTSGTLCVLPNPTVMCSNYTVCLGGRQTPTFMATFPNITCSFCPAAEFTPTQQLVKVLNPGPSETEVAVAGATCAPAPTSPAGTRKYNCSVLFDPAIADNAGTYRIKAYWQRGAGAGAVNYCPRTCDGTLTVLNPPNVNATCAAGCAGTELCSRVTVSTIPTGCTPQLKFFRYTSRTGPGGVDVCNGTDRPLPDCVAMGNLADLGLTNAGQPVGRYIYRSLGGGLYDFCLLPTATMADSGWYRVEVTCSELTATKCSVAYDFRVDVLTPPTVTVTPPMTDTCVGFDTCFTYTYTADDKCGPAAAGGTARDAQCNLFASTPGVMLVLEKSADGGTTYSEFTPADLAPGLPGLDLPTCAIPATVIPGVYRVIDYGTKTYKLLFKGTRQTDEGKYRLTVKYPCLTYPANCNSATAGGNCACLARATAMLRVSYLTVTLPPVCECEQSVVDLCAAVTSSNPANVGSTTYRWFFKPFPVTATGYCHTENLPDCNPDDMTGYFPIDSGSSPGDNPCRSPGQFVPPAADGSGYINSSASTACLHICSLTRAVVGYYKVEVSSPSCSRPTVACTTLKLLPPNECCWCQDCCWDNGQRDNSPEGNGVLSMRPVHNEFPEIKAAADFYLEQGLFHRIKKFAGSMLIRQNPALAYKAKLTLYEDCDGCPGEMIKMWDLNPCTVRAPEATGYAKIDFKFEFPNEKLWLRGGKAYWWSLQGVSDINTPNYEAYWVTSRDPGVRGAVPKKMEAGEMEWTPLDLCCIGCHELAFCIECDSCKIIWDNGLPETCDSSGGTRSERSASPTRNSRAADNFVTPQSICPLVTSNQDPRCCVRTDWLVCYVEGYVYSNCSPHYDANGNFDGFAAWLEIYRNICNKPNYVLTASPAPIYHFIVDRIELVQPECVTTIDGVPNLRLYRVKFCPTTLDIATGLLLAGGADYWLSISVGDTFSQGQRAFFAWNSDDCTRCPIKISPGREIAPGRNIVQWTSTGHDFAFIIAAKATAPDPEHIAPVVTGTATCPADQNRDGSVTVQDLFEFLNAWFTSCP